MQKGSLLLFMSILLGLFSKITIAQVSTDYLESLEGEASALTLDKKTKTTPQNLSSDQGLDLKQQWVNKGGAIVELKPGLTIEQFEIVLKNNYIGSYLFYKRLENDQKDEVFVFYQDNPDPKSIREKILQVSKK